MLDRWQPVTYSDPVSAADPPGQSCERGKRAVKPAHRRVAHSSGLHMSSPRFRQDSVNMSFKEKKKTKKQQKKITSRREVNVAGILGDADRESEDAPVCSARRGHGRRFEATQAGLHVSSPIGALCSPIQQLSCLHPASHLTHPRLPRARSELAYGIIILSCG